MYGPEIQWQDGEPTAGEITDDHYVYRCYDSAGHLLYIGCTQDMVMRMDVHAASWQNPASVGISLAAERAVATTYPDKATARAAEKQAIFDEAPLFNVHHQRERRTPAQNRAVISAYLAKRQTAA